MKEKRQFYKSAMKLAIPIMIQNGITNMVGLVDNVMVGNLGTEQMTGVSIVTQLLFVNNLAIFGAVSGPGIYCAQFFGQGNKDGVRNTFQFKMLVSILVEIIAVFLFLFAGTYFMQLYLHGNSTMGMQQTMHYGQSYLRIMLWTLIPFAITQSYASTMRETGKTLMPMIAGVVSVVIDVIFNYLLIFGKMGFPELGVKGAAIATLASRIAEMMIVVLTCHIGKKHFPYMQKLYSTLKIPVTLVKEMTKKGMPIFFNEFLWAGGIAVLTQCYSIRGLEVVAALNISNTLANLFNVVFVSIGSVTGIMVGTCLGAADFENAKLTSKRLRFFAACISAVLGVILIACSGLFPKVYETTNEIQILARNFIIITALFFPLQGYLNAVYFSLRSGGKTVITFLFDSVYSWTICVPIAYIICRFSHIPILGIYGIIQALDIIKATIGYILIRKGVWIQNLVK